MKVGITVDGRQTELGEVLWSNGIGQNVGYLAMLLQRLPEVEQLVFVTCPDSPAHPLGTMMGIPVMTQTDSLDQLDIVIELGAKAITDVEVDRLRARGGKLVSYLGGNVLAMNFEEVASNTNHGDRVFLSGYDACWITPQHWHMNESYAKLLYTPHTHQVPHIWDPHFLRLSAASFGHNPFYRKPKGPGWKIGILDPTINIIKTFHYPLMIAEEACRAKPDLIRAVLLFNAFRFREMPHLTSMFSVMEVGKSNKATVEERFQTAFLMGQHVEAVVTHHWESNLSYMFWDTLYLGWPLIHNSEAIKHLGYYYPDFNTQAGGKVLIDALETHDERRVKDRPAVLETLWGFSIENPAVQQRYSELLADVMSRPSLPPSAAPSPAEDKPAAKSKAKRSRSKT